VGTRQLRVVSALSEREKETGDVRRRQNDNRILARVLQPLSHMSRGQRNAGGRR